MLVSAKIYPGKLEKIMNLQDKQFSHGKKQISKKVFFFFLRLKKGVNYI